MSVLTSRRTGPGEALRIALPPWIASRLLALACLGLAAAVHHGPLPATGDIADARGLWVWDAGWYRSLAEHGYAGSPEGGIRFFPLFPLLGRWLGAVVGVGPALLLIADLAALAFAVLLVHLVDDRFGRAVAARSAWLVLLAPGAVALSLALSEPLSLALSALVCLAVLTRRVSAWWAVPAGLLAGLTRPTGVLVAAVPLVALLLRRDRSRPALLAASLAPLVGAGVFCAWSAVTYHRALLPYSSQSQQRLRGTIIGNPLPALTQTTSGSLAWPLKLALATAAVALLAVAIRRLPAELTVWSALLVAAALTSGRDLSLARYLSGAFPLLVALALVTERRRWFAAALVVSVTAFGWVAVTAYDGRTVL